MGLRHAEVFRDLIGERTIDVCDGRDDRFGNPTGEIANVHLAEPAETDDPHLQPSATLRCHVQG